MGNIDAVLQNAVNEVNSPKIEPVVEAGDVEEEATEKKVVEKKSKKKPPIEDVPSDPQKSEDNQLDLIPETKPELKKFKVKAYGKEKELEVKDDEIQTYIQKGYAAEEKWKEAQEALRKSSEIEKRNQEFSENFKKDPEKAMELLLGRENLDSISEKRILRAMEMEKMSPEQREEYEVKQRLAKYKKEEEEYNAKKQQAEEEKQVAYFEAQFKNLTTNALKKIGYEKPSKLILNRFLMTIRPFLAHADGPATEEDMDILADHFQKTMEDEKGEHLNSMDGAAIAAYLGKDNVEKLRKHLMNGVKPVAVVQTSTKKEEKPIGNLRDYIKTL